MRLAVFDIETTGLLEDDKAVMTELGYAIWDIEDDRIVEAESEIVDIKDKEVPEKITELTGITRRLSKIYGNSLKTILSHFGMVLKECDASLTRNGLRFDWPFLMREANREAVTLPKTILIDDYYDIEYPSWVTGGTLSHVAADHGFLNPFPHSALGDAMTLIRVMQLGKYNMKDAYESAKHPIVEVRAFVSYDDNHLAKERKFRWDPDRKIWWKRMREFRYVPEEYPFKTEFRRVP